jgi:hypothetical protein
MSAAGKAPQPAAPASPSLRDGSGADGNLPSAILVVMAGSKVHPVMLCRIETGTVRRYSVPSYGPAAVRIRSTSVQQTLSTQFSNLNCIRLEVGESSGRLLGRDHERLKRYGGTVGTPPVTSHGATVTPAATASAIPAEQH